MAKNTEVFVFDILGRGLIGAAKDFIAALGIILLINGLYII